MKIEIQQELRGPFKFAGYTHSSHNSNFFGPQAITTSILLAFFLLAYCYTIEQLSYCPTVYFPMSYNNKKKPPLFIIMSVGSILTFVFQCLYVSCSPGTIVNVSFKI